MRLVIPAVLAALCCGCTLSLYQQRRTTSVEELDPERTPLPGKAERRVAADLGVGGEYVRVRVTRVRKIRVTQRGTATTRCWYASDNHELADLGFFVSNYLLPFIDPLVSTVTYVGTLFDPNTRVLGGPLGWALAMTPLFTAAPGCDKCVPGAPFSTSVDVDDSERRDVVEEERPLRGVRVQVRGPDGSVSDWTDRRGVVVVRVRALFAGASVGTILVRVGAVERTVEVGPRAGSSRK